MLASMEAQAVSAAGGGAAAVATAAAMAAAALRVDHQCSGSNGNSRSNPKRDVPHLPARFGQPGDDAAVLKYLELRLDVEGSRVILEYRQ